MEIIPSPLFYMSNKLKLLPQLKPIFPKKIDTFYDLFGGSGVMSLNIEANKTVYNEKRAFGGWNIDNDYELFTLLEELDKRNIKWGLSNVFQNKTYTNEHLIKWCKEHNWNINHLKCEYASLGKGNSNTDEVYICNYATPKQMTLFDITGV